MTSYAVHGPFTITGQDDIPSEAPRAQGMSDTTAEAIVAANDDLMSQVLHLHIDLAGNTATVGLDNADDDTGIWVDFGDGNGSALTVPDTVTHDYADGIYTVSAHTTTGPAERAQQQLAVNWPAPFPDDPQPFPEAP